MLEADSQYEGDAVGTVQDHSSGQTRWSPWSTVLDSGSAVHVCNGQGAEEVPIVESEGSRRGQHFIAANGSRMPNVGQQHLRFSTEDGAAVRLTYQVADVKRPLCSISQLCDQGNRVMFTRRGGGVIYNPHTKASTTFRRDGALYVLDMWRDRAPSAEDFTRQG